jgi:hypothetical protein
MNDRTWLASLKSRCKTNRVVSLITRCRHKGHRLVLLALCIPNSILAQPGLLSEPFAVRNQNPFVLVYGLPVNTAPDLLPQDGSSLYLQLDLTNNSKDAQASREQIVLDGETYHATLVYQRGLAKGWQMGVTLPLIGHHSGFMDNFIEGWHDIFGFSNGDREDWPQNRLTFSYTRDGVNEVELEEGSTGIGDLQLQISRPFFTAVEEATWRWHASLELPTGDADRMQGSGSVDLALWVSGAYPELFKRWDIGGYLHAGLVRTGDGDLLPDHVERRVWFSGAGLHWRLWSWLMLKGQLDAHGAFYDSQLAQLGKRSVMLTVGGTIPLDQHGGAIDLAIGENLVTDAVPDFMIKLAYRQRF